MVIDNRTQVRKGANFFNTLIISGNWDWIQFFQALAQSFLPNLPRKISTWLISNQLTLNINKNKFFNIATYVEKLLFINIQCKLIRYEPLTKFI